MPKISELPVVSTPTTADVFPFNQASVTSQATLGDLFDTLEAFEQSDTGADARTFTAKSRDIVSIDDFAGSQTVRLQAAVDAMEARGGGTVFIPAGSARTLTATITNNSAGVLIQGAGMWNTIITRATDYGHTFSFTGNDVTGAVLSDCGIRNLSIKSTALTTSGAHIHTNGIARFVCSDIYMLQGFMGFQCLGLTAAYISNIYLVFTNLFGGSATGRRFMEFASAAATYGHPSSGDVFVSDFNVRGNTPSQNTEYGINIESSDGLWFNNGHIGNTSVANIRISPDHAIDHIGLVFFNSVMCDEGAGYSVYLDGDTNQAVNIFFDNCSFKGGGVCQYGVTTSAVANFYGIQFNNCAISEFLNTGIFIQSPDFLRWSFCNARVFANSFATPGGYPGIRLETGVQYGEFNGGSSGNHNLTITGTKTDYGLSVGTVTNIRVDGMDLTGNVTGSILEPGSLTSFYLRNIVSQDSVSVASAATLTLPYEHDFINITGTTGVSNIQVQYSGRRVTLKFADILTVTDGGNLRLASNFTTSADDTLSLICDGTLWYETGRSAN
jgi:hypothetical protein